MSILNAAFAFQCDGKPVSYKAFGSGHINSTYIIKTSTGARYVLQHINKYVFKRPDQVMENVAAVTNYLLKIDGSDPYYQYNGQPNSADVSVKVGKKFKLTIVDKELEQTMYDVVWTFSDDSVCSIEDNMVTGLSKGTCRITAEYQGVTYLVFVRVSE